MRLKIIDSANDILLEDTKGKNVVVIDVLRATSVMITALREGVKSIHVFSEIEETIEASKKETNTILCGERKGLKINGFDYGNSPLEFKKMFIKGKKMFMTTSNGTRAIKNSKEFKNLYIASFLNIQGVIEKLKEDMETDVTIICAGTDNNFSLDDALCAGEIARRLNLVIDFECNDSERALILLAKSSNNFSLLLEKTKHYSYLKKLGLSEDLEYCLSIDKYRIVPQLINDVISL